MIEAYKNFRCLRDPTFEHYKNTTRKQDSWQKIASLLECNVEEAKKKMDSLLASYR
jgi:Alcohol dehydrogenase transcription factor Myb/SANT-like.